MEREKLTLTREEACNIAFGDSPLFSLIKDEITDNSRWSVHHKVIVQRISDGAFFASHYSVGATESQDQSAYEYDDPIFTQVFKQEKTITVYE